MGMSHDFEVAIEEGATIVRVGTAIFGARSPASSLTLQPHPVARLDTGIRSTRVCREHRKPS